MAPPMSFKQCTPLEIHRSNHRQNQFRGSSQLGLWENRAWNCEFCPAKALVGIIAFITEAESEQGQNLLPGAWQVVLLDLAT